MNCSALQEAELQATVVAAGFVEFEITWRADIYAGAPQSSSATAFGTTGINFRARKPRSSEEGESALLSLTCQVPKWPELNGLEAP